MATWNSELHVSCQDILERLGVTKTQAKKIVKIYRNVSVNSTVFCRRFTGENIDVIIAGSRGEGTAVWSVHSDVDILFVQRSVKCFKTCPSPEENTNFLVSFLMDFENVKSGYAMLRLVSVGHSRMENQFLKNIKDGIVLHNGHRYLRNDRVFTNVIDNHREGITKQPFVFDDTTGPANRIVFGLPFLDVVSIDCVQAFPVSYPAILDRWRKRERKYTWPSKDLIENASSQDVFVVPVGVHGSAEEVLQWRLSVTLAEQALIQSFNDTQIKLFVTVKMIVKHELKPICDRMSSYLVKNVMFWISEETEVYHFRRECFDELLLDILKRLKKSIYWKYLQNYMFPSINMLDNKIFETERRKLVRRLEDTIANGCSSALLKCPLVKDIIHMPRNLFQDKPTFIHLVEKLGVAIFCTPKPNFEKLIEKNVIHKRLFRMCIEHIIYVVFRHVLPIIRATNPFDFFDILITMTDEEILYRLYDGGLFSFLRAAA